MRTLIDENLFEVNDNLNITKEYVLDEEIIIIDNFLKYPERLVNYLKNNEARLFKEEVNPSYNGVYFFDRRHFLKHDSKIKEFISKLVQENVEFKDEIVSNIFRMKDDKFNDYTNNFWYPHLDDGYNHTAIIYLNEKEGSGTNLYNPIKLDESPKRNHEHLMPWKSKKFYDIAYTIQSKFNRFVLFSGFKILHGMAIDDDRFKYEDRMNVVIFTHKKEKMYD